MAVSTRRISNRTAFIPVILLTVLLSTQAQDPAPSDSLDTVQITTGWSDNAVTLGIVTAPTAAVLLFVSGIVSDWNAGYFGIPATAMVLAAPPLIYLGGRSAGIPLSVSQPRARLGWVIYGLSMVPAGISMYMYSLGKGINIPLVLATGALGTAAIVTMTTYAFSRSEAARSMRQQDGLSWNFGVAPVRGGAMACVSLRF